VVLARGSLVLGLLLLAGCSESLFGVHHADGDAGSAPTCTGSCIADAAVDFDGTAGGAGGHWRYLEDTRDRMWMQMNADATGMTGTGDPRNHITTCGAKPSAPACNALPGALLVSAAGITARADPAIEFTASTAQVIKLGLHVFVPDGDNPTILLYRNSREDVLFTGTAMAGTLLDQEITLDVLPNDRFLVAVVSPGTKGAADVALDLSASATGDHFPSSCQLSLQFESFTGDSTPDTWCRNYPRSTVFTHLGSTGGQVALMFGAAAFTEQGNAVRVPGGTYFEDLDPRDTLDYSQDVTVQLWVQQAAPSTNTAWLFSDLDPAKGGGIGISILPGAAAMLDVKAATTSAPSFVHMSVMYPSPGQWNFIRVVHSGTNIRVCVNGALATTITGVASKLATSYPPEFGKDIQDAPAAASFDGYIDDIRVITGALPCK